MVPIRRLSPALLAVAFGACAEAPAAHHDAGAPDAGPTGPCAFAPDVLPAPTLHTPRWAFEPWISKDISTGPDTHAFVQGMKDRDIPVGVVVLDSPWETNYNSFAPNPTRYPDFAKMVSDLHAGDVRIVLWITQFVNSVSYDLEMGGDSYPDPAPKLQEGNDCGFFVEDGAQFPWWKGTGAAVDFFNPAAVAWWHRQQDAVLATGIDGWKIDFGDSYVPTDPVATSAGPKAHQAYSEAYYHDFLAYGVHSRGRDFTTMMRAWDESYGFAGRFYARKEDAPVAWMGDNRRDWVGVADALDEMLRSAKAGYAVVGSDVGGYLDHDDKNLTGPAIPFDPTVFARWTAMGALSPLMQLHGRANITPWEVPQTGDQIVKLYRYWAKLHHALVPFFYSLAEETYAGATPIVRPVATEDAWADDYRFLLGAAFLVAPILDATGKRDVSLPGETHWYDWWAPDAGPLDGPQTLSAYDATDLARIPLFVRAGAIVPLNVEDDANGLGTVASAGRLTVLVYPDATQSTFPLHDEDDAVTTIAAVRTPSSATITLSRALRETLLRVRAEAAPASVTVGGTAAPPLASRAAFDAATAGWFYEAAAKALWVKVPVAAGAQTITAG